MSDQLPKFEDTEELPAFDQTEELPSFDQTEEVKNEETLPPSNKSGLAAASAAIGTAVGQNLLGKAYDATVDKLGKLTPEQRATIRTNPEGYKKARQFNDILDDYLKTVKETRQAGIDFSRMAKESLKPMGNVEGSELIKAMSQIEEAPMANILPSEMPEVKAREASLLKSEELLSKKADIDNKIKQMTEIGIESPEINRQLDILKQQSKELNKAASSKITPTIEDYSKATNIPKEVLEQRPSLMNKRLPKSYGDVLSENVDFLKGTELSKFDVADKLIPSYQDQINYSKAFPDEATKFKQELSRNVSNYLKEQEGSETFKRGQELSSRAIKVENTLDDFGVAIDPVTNQPYIKNQNTLNNIFKKENTSQIQRLTKALDEAEKLKQIKTIGGFLPDSDVANVRSPLSSELPLSSIKETVKNAPETFLSRLVKTSAGGVAGGAPGAIAANAVPLTGTKVQELLSLLEANKTLKTLGKASKIGLPIIGGGIAAVASYNDPRINELSDAEKAGVLTGEVVNPIPLTDLTGAYTEGKKELERTGNASDAISKGAEAFIKPASNLYKETQPTFNKAREMERQGVSIPSKEKMSELLQKYQQLAPQKADLINKLENGTEEEKGKAEYQLNQDPAYRIRTMKNKS